MKIEVERLYISGLQQATHILIEITDTDFVQCPGPLLINCHNILSCLQSFLLSYFAKERRDDPKQHLLVQLEEIIKQKLKEQKHEADSETAGCIEK
jgi:hypothetical protein